MPQEIERKFVLGETPEWLAGRPGERIEQGYLAFADGIEVRLRRRGDERLLTVKGGSGELREEVETEIGRDHFEQLWPLTEPRRLAKTRRRASVGDGLEAEVDVYEGELEGLVVAEVEFPDAKQAERFQPPGWLGSEVTGEERYSNRVLAEDGCRRRDAGERQAKTASYRFKRKEDVGKGVRRIARGRADHALQALGDVEEGAALAAAIHSARKDMKKLRALLRLVREELGEEVYRAENERYRDAARLLSRRRDAEAKLETLAALEERFGDELPAGAARAWGVELEEERDEILAASAEDMEALVGRAATAIEAGREEIAAWPPIGDSWSALGPGLLRAYRRGRRELKRTRSEPTAEHVHRWRKRVKDLWYQLRLLRKAWPELLEGSVDQTHRLADLLGDHHDLAVLAEDLGARPGIARREELAGLIARRQTELLSAALELGARVYAEKPGAFERRLRAYWQTWRQR